MQEGNSGSDVLNSMVTVGPTQKMTFQQRVGCNNEGSHWLFEGSIFQAEGPASAKAWHTEGAARKLMQVEHCE